MKVRFKYEPNENEFYCFTLCKEYPDCNCDGHYVWENKKTEEIGAACPFGYI